jgi:hypothetical protein
MTKGQMIILNCVRKTDEKKISEKEAGEGPNFF